MNKQYQKLKEDSQCINCLGCNYLGRNFLGKYECKDFRQAYTDEEIAERLRDSQEYGVGLKNG